jgi:hypothetical protein
MRCLSVSISLVVLCAPFCGVAQPAADSANPREIVRRAMRRNARNRDLERSYTYTLRDEERTLDSANAVKSTKSETWDVIPLQGTQFRRLIQRNDKPLSTKEEQQQEAERQKRETARRIAAEVRAKETPEQRQKRMGDRWRADSRL